MWKIQHQTLVLLLASVPGVATAGSLQFQDEASLVPPGQVAELHQSAARLPFNVSVLIRTTESSKTVFERTVENRVENRGISIGLDPAHRVTAVYYGRALNIPPSEFARIRSTGNAFFKSGNFVGGIEAIENTTQSVIQSQAPPIAAARPVERPRTVETTAPAQTPALLHEEHHFPWGAIFLVLFCVGVMIAIGTIILRRQKKFMEATRRIDRDLDETPTYNPAPMRKVQPPPAPPPTLITAPPSYTPPAYVPPPVRPYIPTPAPVVVHEHHHHDSGGDFTTGLLMGEMIADRREPVRERVIVERAPDPPRRRSDDGDAGSWAPDPTPVRSEPSGGGDSGGWLDSVADSFSDAFSGGGDSGGWD